jgi:glycosyltransferase involved in cell wall biosynthesis
MKRARTSLGAEKGARWETRKSVQQISQKVEPDNCLISERSSEQAGETSAPEPDYTSAAADFASFATDIERAPWVTSDGLQKSPDQSGPQESVEASRAVVADEAAQLRTKLVAQAQIVAEQSVMIASLGLGVANLQKQNTDLVIRVDALVRALAIASGTPETTLTNPAEIGSALNAELGALRRTVFGFESALADKFDRLNARLSVSRDRVSQLEALFERERRQMAAARLSFLRRLIRPVQYLFEEFKRRAHHRLIAESGLLDREWYDEAYPDVRGSGIDSALHYLTFGAAEGRNPNPLFWTNWYLTQYPDVRATNVNPLVHYLRHGAAEGRDPNPLFDGDWYLQQNPDVRAESINPLVHYLRCGAAKGRNPNPRFNGNGYLQRYPDARDAGVNPLVHYVRYATAEARFSGLAGSAGSAPDASANVFKPPSNLAGHDGLQIEALNPRVDKVKGPTIVCENAIVGEGDKLNIIFINYGSYNNNSAAHIAGFANMMATRGHTVLVSCEGDPSDASDFGEPSFWCISREALREDPGLILREIDPGFLSRRTIVHCWTPRESVRRAAMALVEKFNFPYVVHFEDNERQITETQLGISRSRADRMSAREWDDTVPPSLSHPARARALTNGATGVTVIVDSLRSLIDCGSPIHLLEPGIESNLFAPERKPEFHNRLRAELGVPQDTALIVYCGNMHAANVREMFSLYTAIHILNRRGQKAHLIRTGEDFCSGLDVSSDALRSKHVTELGFVKRSRLIEIMKLADLFIQPGTRGPFNDYRLPSKLPEFLSLGRPVILPETNIGLALADGVNALLLRRGDGVEIADRALTVLRNKGFADGIGQNARSFAIRHFDWRCNATLLESLYYRLLGQSSVSTDSLSTKTAVASQ